MSPATIPIVLEPCTTLQVLHLCIEHPAAHKHVLICSSREDFLHNLLDEIQQDERSSPAAFDLLAPTLHNLQASRNINMAFCHDLASLHAYLPKLSHEQLLDTKQQEQERPDQIVSLLMVVNPIRLHEPTSSYSVQGLNKTFAAIVESSHHLNHQLILVECSTINAVQTSEDDEMLEGVSINNVWDESVSMLNVTTKTFGAGERGWVGRSVKIRQVAERWCRFVTLEGYDKERR